MKHIILIVILISTCLLHNSNANEQMNQDQRDSSQVSLISSDTLSDSDYGSNEFMGCIAGGSGITLLSIPVALFNSFALVDVVDADYTGSSIAFASFVILQMTTAYFLGENIGSDKFILNGYIGPNYSSSIYNNSSKNIGGNISIYSGFKIVEMLSAGFEFNTVYRSLNFEEESLYNLDFMIPFTIGLHVDINKLSSIAFYSGFGRSFSFRETPKFSGISNSVDYPSHIKFSTEYKRKKNIVRASFLSSIDGYDEGINTMSLEYGRSFY